MNEVRFSIGKVVILFLRCGNVNVVVVIDVVAVNVVIVVIVVVVVVIIVGNESKGVS